MKPLYQRVAESNKIETVKQFGRVALVNNMLSFHFSDERIAKEFCKKLSYFKGI